MRRIALFAIFCLSLYGCVTALTPRELSLYDQGRWVEMIQLIEPKVEGNPNPSSTDLFYLCNGYVHARVYSKAIACADKLDKALLTGETSLLGMDFRPYPNFFRAEANIDLGRYNEAARVARASYDTAQEVGTHRRSLIELLPTLGVAYALAGRPEDAAWAVAQLEDIGTYYPFILLAPLKQAGLARMYMAVGRYADAAAVDVDLGPFGVVTVAMGSAVSGYEVMRGERFYQSFIKAKALNLSGRPLEAKPIYDRLLSVDLLSNYGAIQWQAHHDRGWIALLENDRAVARLHFSAAIEAIESQRSSIGDDASKIGYVGNRLNVYRDLIDLLMEDGEYGAAFEAVERAKARALVDMLATRKRIGRERGTGAAALIAELDRLEQQSIALVTLNGGGTATRSAQINATRKALRQESPELASLVTVGAPAIASIQGRLGADEALLEYYGYADSLYAFVVTRTSVDAFELDGSDLGLAVSRFRKAVQNYTDDSYRPVAREMYDRLVRPLADKLSGKLLTVVPHGPLHYLPFAALHDGNQFLIDRFDMRLLPSASVLQFLDKPGNADQELLAFGNPDLGDPSLDLPGAQEETRVIDQGWTGSRILLRKLASEANFKKFAPGFRYLHLASHGEFNPTDPLQSRMLLAPGEGEDGNLTVDELYSLRLNADMVTLSACETGLGDVASGDDVIGLTRGFLYAGAKSIVASLWPVSDQATAHLMKEFYAKLRQVPKAQALRAALLSTKQRFDHPIFWSAFNLTGAT